jgi:hypothetical protein
MGSDLVIRLLEFVALGAIVFYLEKLRRWAVHDFDRDLEEQKSGLRRIEELTSQSAQILRSGPWELRAQRNAILTRRRIEAVEKLWAATHELGEFKWISQLSTIWKMDKAAEAAEKDINFRETFSKMGGDAVNRTERLLPAELERPFVSPLAWALFAAYRSALLFALARWKVVSLGMSEGLSLLKVDVVRAMLSKALPEKAEYVAVCDENAFHYLLDELEERLLSELRSTLIGYEDDAEAVRQAAGILQLANEQDLSVQRLKASTEANR